MVKYVVEIDTDKLSELLKNSEGPTKEKEETTSKMKSKIGYPAEARLNNAQKKAVKDGEEFLDNVTKAVFEREKLDVRTFCDKYASEVVGEASIDGLIAMLQLLSEMNASAIRNLAQSLVTLLLCPPGHLKETMQHPTVKQGITAILELLVTGCQVSTVMEEGIKGVTKELMKRG